MTKMIYYFYYIDKMSLKSEINSILNFLKKIEKQQKNSQESSDDLFGGLKVIPKAFPSSKLIFDKQKFRQYFAQPYNFIHIIKFLDIKNLLNVGLINKEFNVFVSSVYVYKILYSSYCVKPLKNTKIQSLSPKSVSSSRSAKSSKSYDATKKGNLFGGLFKNVGNYFFGNSKDNKQLLVSKELILRINLHEEILQKIKKRFEIENDIRVIREEFDSLVSAEKNKVI
jgi:hypothetical protein